MSTTPTHVAGGTQGIPITRKGSGSSDSSGMGSFVDAEKEFNDISKQEESNDAPPPSSNNDTKEEFVHTTKPYDDASSPKNDVKKELNVISKQVEPNDGAPSPPRKKKKKKKRSASSTRRREERKTNDSININTSMVTNTTTESQATILHRNGAAHVEGGENAAVVSKYKNIEGLLKKKGDQAAKERASSLLADPDKAKKASDILHNALQRSESLTLTNSKEDSEKKTNVEMTKQKSEGKSQAKQPTETAETEVAKRETENKTQDKPPKKTSKPSLDNYDPFKISDSSEPEKKKKKKKKKKRIALPPPSPAPFFSTPQNDTKKVGDIELRQLDKPLPKSVIKNGKKGEQVKSSERIHNTVRFEPEIEHPECKARKEVMRPILAGKKFNLATSVMTGVAAIVFGLMLSMFAESTCSFVTYQQNVGYYSEAFDVHLGMWEHAPIGNAFTNSYASCVSYSDPYSTINPPTVSRSSGILALAAGGFSLAVLWSYLLFLRFNALFWKIAVYSALIAAFCQSLTLGVFFGEVCSENACDAGPGSLSSVISTIMWAFLAREMHSNHPMKRKLSSIDSSKFMDKNYYAPELV